MTKIAVVLTVYNRKQKTISCLQHLYDALDVYNKMALEPIVLSVYITDDGCTDGTSDAIRATFPSHDIHIVQGTGNLFWAGGMRLAWQTAIDSGSEWDYYLLLNDDTNVWKNLFVELFEADKYVISTEGKRGITSGITCQPNRPEEITYGGCKFTNKTKGCYHLIHPSGVPQEADITHANILLVHKNVVDKIGIFYKGYRHGGADIDYSMNCRRHGLPVFVTSQVCGECEFDHHSNEEEIRQLMTMTLAERKKYVKSPTHSDHDYLLHIRRHLPLRYPIAVLLRKIRIYCPKLYYRISHFRGVYK